MIPLFRRSSSLRHRLTIGMSIMLLPLLSLGVGALIGFERSINRFERTDNKTLEELFPVTELEALMINAEDAIKTCYVDQSVTTCDRHLQLTAQIQRQYEALLDSPSILPEKEVLVQNSYKIWSQLQRQLQAQIRQNQPNSPKFLDQVSAEIQQTVKILDRIQALLIHYQTTDNLEQVQVMKQEFRGIIILVFLLSLGTAIVAGWSLSRSILSPLKVLQAGVNHLGNGQLSYRIALDTQDEFGQLAGLFNQMAETLEHNQTELINLATLDGLTGVFNRREFTKRFKAELERAQRYQHACSLLMFDIDFFKKLNDTYGHQAGDEALKQVAALLKQEVRLSDQVARYGGEEFAVIMAETRKQDAVQLAERLRQKLEKLPVSTDQNQTIYVTASIGVSTFPADAQDAKTLLSAADQALYAAKHKGRNQVISYCQT